MRTFALGEYILLIDESNFSLANFLAEGCLGTAAAAVVDGIVISGAILGANVARALSPSTGAFVAFISHVSRVYLVFVCTFFVLFSCIFCLSISRMTGGPSRPHS